MSHMEKLLVALLFFSSSAFPVHAQTLITLESFNNTNRANPYAGLIADAAGNLFGTTESGGTSGHGTVFEIANSGFVTSPAVMDVPEPALVALLGAGIVGLAALRRQSGGRKLIGGQDRMHNPFAIKHRPTRRNRMRWQKPLFSRNNHSFQKSGSLDFDGA